MIAQLLAPTKLDASRYPIREVVEEREVAQVEDAIEEMSALAGAWLIIRATGRTLHYEADQGRWRFKKIVAFTPEEE